MAVVREDLIPTLIPNTSMQKIIVNGVHTQYGIKANEGYVLHDNSLDEEEINEETYEPTGNIILGFYRGTRTVNYNYNFIANPREFYAILETELPENSRVCDVGNNDHKDK